MQFTILIFALLLGLIQSGTFVAVAFLGGDINVHTGKIGNYQRSFILVLYFLIDCSSCVY